MKKPVRIKKNKNMSKTQKSNSSEKTAGIVVGVAAVGAIAYLLFGPEGKKNQKIAKGWAVKMKGEIMEEIEKLEEISGPIYEKIVDKVGEKYKKIKNVDLEDVVTEINNFKKSWKEIEKKSKAPTKKVVAKKMTKKTLAK